MQNLPVELVLYIVAVFNTNGRAAIYSIISRSSLHLHDAPPALSRMTLYYIVLVVLVAAASI
jgi:hypothetical protein